MLNPDTAARIKACRGVYSLSDTARHFGVSKRTVHNAWHGKTHTSVSPAPEPDNVITTRVSPEVIYEDGRTLLQRGLTVAQAAEHIGVSPNTVRRYVERAPSLMVFG